MQGDILYLMHNCGADGILRLIKVFGHLGLSVNHHIAAKGCVEIHPKHRAVTGQIAAAMHLALGVHAAARTRLAQHFDRAPFQNPGADARQHIVAAFTL